LVSLLKDYLYIVFSILDTASTSSIVNDFVLSPHPKAPPTFSGVPSREGALVTATIKSSSNYTKLER